MKQHVVLICGGRDYNRKRVAFAVFAACHQILPIKKVVQGEAMGADRLGKNWAKLHNIKCKGYPAQWDKFGRRAGFLRNKQMLDEEKIDYVIALSGGPGTKMMVELAEARGIKVIKI